jgi:sugar/nucleoside kinase (ribokinase family)
MALKFDLLVLGEICVDIILSGDVTPAFGQVEKVLDDAVLTAGSSSAIFACGAARLGLKVAFAGMVGDDLFGRFMLDALAARNVDTRGVVVSPTQKTGLTVHLIRGADRAMLTHMGAMETFGRAHLDRELLHAARHLHVGSYFLQKGLRPDVAHIFAEAEAAGITTSLDTGYDPDEAWGADVQATLVATTLFLPNATEALALTGAAHIDDALADLAARVPVVAIKMGAEGARARAGATEARTAALPVHIVDTTGAGDSFDAGFVYGFLKGWPLQRSLQLGAACGSLSTMGAGGTDAQPTLAAARAALAAQGVTELW